MTLEILNTKPGKKGLFLLFCLSLIFFNKPAFGQKQDTLQVYKFIIGAELIKQGTLQYEDKNCWYEYDNIEYVDTLEKGYAYDNYSFYAIGVSLTYKNCNDTSGEVLFAEIIPSFKRVVIGQNNIYGDIYILQGLATNDLHRLFYDLLLNGEMEKVDFKEKSKYYIESLSVHKERKKFLKIYK